MRLIEIYAPVDHLRQVQRCLTGDAVLWSAKAPPCDGLVHVRALVASERVEAVLDPLETALGDLEAFRVLVLPVEAHLPQPAANAAAAAPVEKLRQRISRQELYEDVSRGTRLSGVYVATVVLSTIVAAVGLANDAAVAVIAAMVIAPLLGPNMALALAATLGDGPLARRALAANLVGVSLALAMSVAVGLVWRERLWSGEVSSELMMRTQVSVADLAVALASGAAGALAMTTRVSTSLVGVMVAVALLPPLVVFGMALAKGALDHAAGAGLLLLSNVVCVNLAAITTFLVQGINPRTWNESERARRTRTATLAMLIAALVALTVIILVASS